MNNFLNLTTIEFAYSKEEKTLKDEVNALLSLAQKKQKERAMLTEKRINDFLSRNVADFTIGEIIYNVSTHEEFFVDSLEPFHVSITKVDDIKETDKFEVNI